MNKLAFFTSVPTDADKLTLLKNVVSAVNLVGSPTAHTTQKAYLTATTGTSGIQQHVYDSLVYLDTASGALMTGRVYNAVYSDYAEFFPKGEETEPGDIVMLDVNSDEESYIKAVNSEEHLVLGVHSEEYAHIIGGDAPEGDLDYISYNLQYYIPVGLMGRCHVKITGPVKKGYPVIPSNQPGVGVCDFTRTSSNVVGYLVESDSIENETVRLLKIKLV